MKPSLLWQVGTRALQNFLLGGNLVSLRWLTNPSQLIGYNAETLFLYKTIARERGLPLRNVFEVLPGGDDCPIVLSALHSETAWFSTVPSYTQDIVSLCLLCQLLKPRIVFEIGTAAGYTSLHLALNTPAECEVYTLDLPRDRHALPELKTTAMDEFQMGMYAAVEQHVFASSRVAPKITCLYGDSATFDYAPFHGRVDLFFIDGAHSYEYVRSDTLHALDCCHPGSVIAWHDFGRAGLNGVSRWLTELAREREIYVVPGGSLAFMRIS